MVEVREPNKMICRVQIEHQAMNYVNTTQVTFLVMATETRELYFSAVQDALRWWAHRQKHLPEHFGTMYALKAYEYRIWPINADGSTSPNTSMPFFEWKHDWPGTIQQYMEMKLK